MPTITDADYSEKDGVADYYGNDQAVNGREEDDEDEIVVFPLAVSGQEMPFVTGNDEHDKNKQDSLGDNNNNNNNNDKEEDGAMEEGTARASSFLDASNSSGPDDGVSSAFPFTSEGHGIINVIDVDDYAAYAKYARGDNGSLMYKHNINDSSKNQHRGFHFTGGGVGGGDDDDDEGEIVVVDGQDERQSLLLEARLMATLEARLEARFEAKLHERVASILRSELTAATMDQPLGGWNGHAANPLHGELSGRPHPAVMDKEASADGDKSRDEKRLTEDTFSFFIVSKVQSKPFILALMVTGLQLAVFCLAAVGLVDLGSPNPLKIPSDVDPNVRILQFLLLIVAVVFTKDLIVVFDIAKEGFSRVIYKAFKYATKRKFFFSLTLRTLTGAFSLVVLFFLIIASDNVVEMLLNFAALEFVTQLDEALFFLSLQGFLGGSCEKSSLVVVETTYYSKENRHQQMRKILFMFTFYLALLSGWIYVVVKQQNGAYQCSTILIQFDDDIRPELGSFSGLYDLDANRAALLSTQRVTYAERRSDGKAKFGYCPDISAWTFSLEESVDSNAIMDRNGGGYDPCNWIARSTQTSTFDLAHTIDSAWYVQDENGREVILEPFYLSCYECDNTENECNGRGTCSNAICRCDGDWFGMRCEFEKPCSRLGSDKRYDESFSSARPWSKELELLLDGEDGDRPVVVYNRPIYVNQTKNEDFDVIFFAGRRWAATAASFLFDFVSQTGSQDQVKQLLANYFRDHFHAHWSSFELEFLTEPVDWGTDNDFSTPVNLRWGNAAAKANGSMSIQSADSAVPVKTVFLCSFCDETNPCRYNGVCGNEGRCQCAPGSNGALCEDAPTGNGHCDPYFNTPAWANDGGDCCESTCRSSSSFICGTEGAGFINTGYFHCNSSSSAWHSHDISTLVSDSGTMSLARTVALSFSGNVLAVEGDNFAQVDIFDKLGDGWSWQYSVSPANSTGNAFQKVAVLEKNGVVWNPLLPIPAKVFVYDTDGTYGTVYVFLCALLWCDEVPIYTYSKARGFDVSSTDVVAILNGYDQVEVYESLSFESGYFSRGNFSVYGSGIPPVSKGIIKISDDASAFALAHISGDTQRNFVLGASIVAYNGTDYVQRGTSIDLHTTNSTETFAVNVAIADSGTVFAAVYCEVGSPAFMKTYDWNQADWVSRQPPFLIDDTVCKTTGSLGLEMSADGQVVALSINDMVLSLGWSEEGWEPIGEPLRASIFSLSGDGHSLAVGDAAGVRDARGPRQTIVFSKPKPALCKDSAVLFRLSLTVSDASEFGLGWVLTNNETQEILRTGNGGNSLETTVAEECLDRITDDCFSLYLFGFGNQDGIGEWPASYGVVLNGALLPTDPFDHGSLMKINFGSCSVANSSSIKNVCTSGTSLLEVVAVLQDNPENLAWRLLDHDNNEVVLEGGPDGHLNGSIVEQNACLDLRERCFFFEVENGYPGGFLNPDIFIVGLYLDGIGQSSTLGGRDYTQGRIYLGYNECCPEGSSRAQVKISSCGGAEWVLSTLDGAILAEGVSDGEADAADCQQDYWHYLCVDYEVTCMVLTYSAGYSNATAEIYSSDYNAKIYGYQPSKSFLMGNCTHFSSPGEPSILLEGVPLGNQSSTYYFQEYRLEGVESGDIFECSVAGYDLNVSFEAALGDTDDPYNLVHCLGETSCVTWPPAYPSDTILSVSVEAIEPFTNLTITCSIWTPPAPIYLSDGVPLGNQSLSIGFQEYRLEGIPMDGTVTCRLDGPYDFENDADLYADYVGDVFNFTAFACRSESAMSTEMCELPPAPNDNAVLFVFVYAYFPYSDVTIMCSIRER